MRLIEYYPKTFNLTPQPKDSKRIISERRIACSIGIERFDHPLFTPCNFIEDAVDSASLHIAGNSIGKILAFYLLGLRYMKIAWTALTIFH
jgi:hypothetical protein